MLPASIPVRTGNRILDRLPPNEAELMLRHAETVDQPSGLEIYPPNGPMPHVYFPIRGVYSFVVVSREGHRTEAATVGNEGIVGLNAYLGLEHNSQQVIVQVPCQALRVPTDTFRRAVKQSESLDRMLLRYIAFSLRYANQTIACNALHSVEERACRWLLMAHDRADAAEFHLTQEFLSQMLAVRRQSISIVAGALQKQGMITYTRGLVRVLDRKQLEDKACECYHVIREYYERIMQC
jgi:CRP-like cAMP-binding protein